MIEDNGDNNRSEQHPDRPKQPQEKQNAEVIAAHTHGVMHHAAIENFRYIFGSYLVRQIGWDVDHEINVVQIADGQAEAKEYEKEILAARV